MVKNKPVLKLVHVVGSKYVDFFTDGTTIFSFPGDPLIDANLNRPDATIPTHAGLTWVSSKGMEAYDTASGDLEPGTYAQEVNGSFIANVSGSSASATSTPRLRFRYWIRRLTPALRPRSKDYRGSRAFGSYSCASRGQRCPISHLFPLRNLSDRLKHA